MLELALLGPPEIRVDGRPASISRRKTRALLLYLAAHPAPLQREQLAATFWPDHDQQAARQMLRTALYGLRQVLGDDLVADEAFIALAPDAAVDVRRWEQLLDPPVDDLAALEQLLGRWRGEFLAGFDLPDLPDFEDWRDHLRTRTRDLAVAGWAHVARLYEQRGDYRPALAALDKALTLEPLREDLQREALRLQVWAGDRAGAIRRYEQLRDLLDAELGMPPLPETAAVYDAIITEALPTPPKPAPVTPHPSAGSGSRVRGGAAHGPRFVGRAGELELLERWSGAGGLLLIEGEPGAGKSRLAREFAAKLGRVLLSGAARELERSLPYQPLVEALRDLPDIAERGRLLSPVWRAEAARLLPELNGVMHAQPADESRLWEALRQLFSTAGGALLLLDDLHWADAATLGVLGYLARQSAPEALLLVGTAREVPQRSPLAALLQQLTREGQLRRLALSRLPAADQESLASELASSLPEDMRAHIVRQSDGNPYFLIELTRYASSAGITCTTASIPQTVQSLVRSRLDGLSDAARRLLDLAAVAGEDLDLTLLSAASGLGGWELEGALDELGGARLIVASEDGGERFDHELTREVMLGDLRPTRRRLLHQLLAETLERLHHGRLADVAGQIAAHFRAAGAESRAAHFALLAARHAAALAAWREAVALYEQVLPSAGPDRAQVLHEFGAALVQAAEPGRAADALREALALGGLADPDDVREVLARALLMQARFAEVYEIAAELLHGSEMAPVRGHVLWGTTLSIEGADLAGAAEHLRHAEARLSDLNTPDRTLLAHIQFEQGSVAAQRGDLEQAVARYRQALATATAAGPAAALHWLVLAHNNLAYHLHLLGVPEAARHAEAGLAIAQEYGALALQPYLLSTLGEIALAAETLEQAEARFAAGLALAEQLDMRERVAGLTANLGLVAIRQGQHALATQRLFAALRLADDLGTQHLATQIRIWLAPLLPEPELAALLAEARSSAERSGRQRLLEQIVALEGRPHP